MLRSLLLLACIAGFAAACAPNSPKPACKPIKAGSVAKCASYTGQQCSPATIGKDKVTCAPGALIFLDTDTDFGAGERVYCSGNQWRYTAGPDDGPIPGGNIKAVCVVP